MSRELRPAPLILHVLGLIALALFVAFGWHTRVRAAVSDPSFDARQPVGILKSDPALLFYLTQRVVDAGGGTPDDWRADARIAYPETVDVPAVYTVGQEFLVAWAYRTFGGETPLHLFCVRLMALVASLAAVGLYGCAFELTRSVRYALLAVLLFTLVPAAYRTAGFVLVREDLALPLFSLHLWAIARAARRPTVAAVVCAAATLGAALATWHAMTYLAALEAAVLFAWLMRTGESPFQPRRAWIGLVVLAFMCFLVPALNAKRTIVSPAMLLAFGLAGAAFVRGERAAHRRAVALCVTAAGIVTALAWARATQWGEFGHVFELLRTKLVHLGRPPADPSELSFEARMLWQGPFETLPIAHFRHELGFLLVLALPAFCVGIWSWMRPTGERNRERAVLAGSTLLAMVAAWLVLRLVVLPALLLPLLAAVTVAEGQRWLERRYPDARRRQVPLVIGSAVIALCLLPQVFIFAGRMRMPIFWYHQPPRPDALVEMIGAVDEHVPEGQAVASDFLVSAAVLAHTQRPIVLQPKWETTASRRRVERYWEAFYHDTPEAFARLLDEWKCRYLLVDRQVAWSMGATRYLARLAGSGEPPPGTAAAAFLQQDAASLVPGFELVWTSEKRTGLHLYRRAL